MRVYHKSPTIFERVVAVPGLTIGGPSLPETWAAAIDTTSVAVVEALLQFPEVGGFLY